MQNEIVFVTGRKGSGKTTLASAIARRLYLNGERVLVWAPMGGFDLPGAPEITTTSELLDPAYDRRSLVALGGDDLTLGPSLFKYAYVCGDLWLVVDEVDQVLDHYNPDESLMAAIRYGRHRGLSLIGISQRPANVARDLTAQADYLIMFNSTENRDVDYLAARIGRENGEAVRSIEQFNFLVYSAYHGGLIESEDFPDWLTS